MINFSKFRFLGLGQKNNEGPPDLDEVLRDITQKINNLFGRNSGGNNNNNQPAGAKDFDVPVLPILAVSLA